MPNKATFIFADGRFGWTESYYDKNDQGSLENTGDAAVELANGRKQFLAGTTPKSGARPQLNVARISTVGVPRKTILIGLNGNKNVLNDIKNPVAQKPPADNPYSAIAVVLTLNSGRQSKRSFSGLSDQLILDQAIGSGTGLGKMEAFLKSLTTKGVWGALGYDRDTVNQSLVQDIVQGADGRVKLTLVAPVTPTEGECSQKVVVEDYTGAPGTPVINGIQTAVPDATGLNWTLDRVFKPVSPLCKGKLLLWEPETDLFNRFVITGPAKKSRGRPLRLPRGRSRSRR